MILATRATHTVPAASRRARQMACRPDRLTGYGPARLIRPCRGRAG